MTRHLLGLVAQLLATLVVATVLIFLVLRVLPGDAAVVALGLNATPEALAQWRALHGTDRPLLVQYGEWVGGMLRGDLGTSFVTGRELTPLVADRLQVTLILVGLGMLLALLAAVPLGTLAAVKHRSPWGTVIAGASQVGVAIPNFLVGVLLVSYFAVRLGWLPAGGWTPPAVDPAQFWRHVILPVVALGTVQAAIVTRYVRSAVLEVMREDFLRTARAAGHTRGSALVRHGLRNAGVPVVTVVGVQLAAMLVGAVVVERVFVVPGLGSLLVDSVAQRDLQAVQSIVAVLVLVVVVVNFLVDFLYTVLDPRLRVAAR
ncbi:ABC transporter permease [Xylanimonas oleitrophica]|uniref:ABC transporter permease n=1 Tax=Xylanimonas oleitrophica TaxID=2607479 RepID=A0A2W5WQQ5_9MICO|nr:ABC transporter permease [Xylanimonas oleitrophica]PZR53480.1 ABC transporter permease [Xylanimonas oleitrophica]